MDGRLFGIEGVRKPRRKLRGGAEARRAEPNSALNEGETEADASGTVVGEGACAPPEGGRAPQKTAGDSQG